MSGCHIKLYHFVVSSEPKKILHSPKTVGLYATRNFHNTYYDWTEEKDIHLGVWHILPNYVANKFSNELGLSEVLHTQYAHIF